MTQTDQIFERIIANASTLEVAVRFLDPFTDGLGKFLQSALQGLAHAIDDGILDAVPDDEEKTLVWQWLGVLDEKICERCEFYDGNQWDENMEPLKDGPEFEEPPLHPNCRCQIVQVDPDAEPVPKNAKLDTYLRSNNLETNRIVFGDAAAEAFDRGEISAREMMRGNDKYVLSPARLEELGDAWKESDNG